MTDTIENSTKTKNSVNNSGTVPLLDIFFMALRHWVWIVVSVFFCVGCAYVYLLRLPNVYTRSAKILIKDDSKGKSSVGGADDFGDFGLFSNNTNIQNEIMALMSPDLMEEVVERLDLDMGYYLPGRFHKTVAYGSTLPVKVVMADYPDNSSATFKIKVESDGNLSISDMRLGSGEEAANTYTGKLCDTINTIAGQIVVEPSAYFEQGDAIDLDVVKSSLAAVVSSYSSRLVVSNSNDKGSVIDLTFTDQNIQRADEVLNTIIGVYNENWIRDKNRIAVSTSNFINERINVIEGELGNVDSDISSYKSENLVPDVNAAASSYMEETQQLSQEILGLDNQLRMARYIRSYLSDAANGDKALPANTGLDNLGIQAQIEQYNAKLLERNNLVAKSSEKNPLAQARAEELEQMRRSIIGSVDNFIVGLQTQIKGLNEARGAATSRLASNPTQAKYLLSVERQQKVKESLYLFLLQKREDNELSQAFTAYNTRVIKRPGGSDVPTAPQRSKILLCSFILGLLLPFGVVYIKETQNTRLRGRKDVEGLALPMLGEIPLYSLNRKGKYHHKKRTKQSTDEIIVSPGSRNVINEAFRVLRTNTEFTRINKESCNVLAVTSFNPGSGKSFIVVNLAAALSIKNRRVLVIDGDMRRGSTSTCVNSPSKGLADYLSGNINDVKSLFVTPEGYPKMQVLPVGTMPPNPTELLEMPRFGEFIAEMRNEYDYILIDCPPIEVVADAQIIDQVVDRTIFVLRAGLFVRAMLPELDHLYEDKKFKHMAFILNGTDNTNARYGNGHTYKYGYAYGYGDYYGSDGDGK